jgi:predicted ATPase
VLGRAKKERHDRTEPGLVMRPFSIPLFRGTIPGSVCRGVAKMRLCKAQVRNFRAIVDSEIVDIQDRVTVLIGKNEQGKTTFLKALASANPPIKYGPGDFPNHLRAELEQKKSSDIPVVTLWLAPEPSDGVLAAEIIANFDSVDFFKVTKFFDSHRTFSAIRQNGNEEPLVFNSPNIQPQIDQIRQFSKALRDKLSAHGERQAEFKANLAQAQSRIDEFVNDKFAKIDQIENLIRTFATGLTSVPGQDAAIQEDIAGTVREIEKVHAEITRLAQSDPQLAFDRLLPQFVLHSTSVDKIPNDVNIGEFVKNPDTVSKGMANLCRVAGLTMSKIQELANTTSAPTRETFEDHYKGNVSGGINEYWTQEAYQVHFRFDKDIMSVSVSDSHYSPRIPPSERSDGFQWYLSFYAAVLSEVSKGQPIIFALDNPGLELHPDGQRDIKRFLEEKLPANAQVIYVTHSPAMIDPFNLEQVRQVELMPDKNGTKVTKLAFKEGADADLLEPVRSAIGASIATSLVMNDFNVLVEGAADKPILDGAFYHLHRERAGKIIVNGSISESPDAFLVSFYERAHLPYAVYIDADSGGRKIATQLEGKGVSDKKIASLDKMVDVPNGIDMELEDIISAEFYHSAVQAAYPEIDVKLPDAADGKRTKQYEKRFKDDHHIGFNKRRVGDQLKKLLMEGKADAATIEQLTKVTASILAALDAQVPGKQNQSGKDVAAPTAVGEE